jgi:hypothetical protein
MKSSRYARQPSSWPTAEGTKEDPIPFGLLPTVRICPDRHLERRIQRHCGLGSAARWHGVLVRQPRHATCHRLGNRLHLPRGAAELERRARGLSDGRSSLG